MKIHPYVCINKIVNYTMDTTKKRHTDNKEADILHAAEREFLSKGYAGARTTAIAEAAGVTHAMLHYYFRTKEQLFKRILDEKLRLMGQSVLAAFGQPELPLMARIKDGIERHFDFIAANPELPLFIVNEIFAHPERYELMQENIRALLNPLQYSLQQELDESAARNDTEPIDARMLLIDIISLNVFAFIAFPIIQPLLGDLTADREHFFAQRKQENIETIMRRLKKL